MCERSLPSGTLQLPDVPHPCLRLARRPFVPALGSTYPCATTRPACPFRARCVTRLQLGQPCTPFCVGMRFTCAPSLWRVRLPGLLACVWAPYSLPAPLPTSMHPLAVGSSPEPLKRVVPSCLRVPAGLVRPLGRAMLAHISLGYRPARRRLQLRAPLELRAGRLGPAYVASCVVCRACPVLHLPVLWLPCAVTCLPACLYACPCLLALAVLALAMVCPEEGTRLHACSAACLLVPCCLVACLFVWTPW